MEKYNNYVRINSTQEKRDLQTTLHPDKKHLPEPLANDLMAQFNNSTCYKIKIFPCVIKFDKDVDNVIQAYNAWIGGNAVQGSSEGKLDFFIKPYIAYLSGDNTLHHGHLVEAVSDFFDGILMYY